jgi:DNA (cytosine-5)-methyltransferase 1
LRLKSETELKQIETYSFANSKFVRSLILRDGSKARTSIIYDPEFNKLTSDCAASFDLAWLQSKEKPLGRAVRPQITAVDLFAGCGGLSLGIREAAHAVGAKLRVKMAVDVDGDALEVFGLNFPEAQLKVESVEDLLDGKNGSPATKSELALKRELGKIDILIGGPPCQGHSDLNNHTRNHDQRNELYLRMARFCEIMKPKHVLIENVPGVLRDKNQVAQKTWKALERQGYFVQSVTIDVSEYGVAQKRKRNLTVASLTVKDDVVDFLNGMKTPVRPLKWAIEDLGGKYSKASTWDSAPTPSVENTRRINYLFENKIFNLPDSERPDCHRLKQHTYLSVYGRLHWGKPAPTITTGFGSMGRGRNVHPAKPRTITPHEAARIQFFPDFFSFGNYGRTLFQKFIGNAVPPKLGYLMGVFLFR